MLEWLARYWLEVLFSGVLAGGGYLIRRLWKKQQEEEARQKSIKEAIIALLRAELVHAYYHYYERGWKQRRKCTMNTTVWAATALLPS